MPDTKSFISKIKLANGSTVYLKDADGRADMTTLLGSHALKALGEAAWLGVDTALTDNGAGVVTGGVIKNYVDSQVGAINKFDIKVVASLPEPSAETMYILYLVAEAGAESGTYVEYITVRSSSESGYTYTMEKIGTTAADLTDYVKKTCKVAGIDLADDITVTELQVALQMGAMAKADTASGSDTIETIDSITMKPVTVAGNATVTHTPTAAGLTKGDFTPSGEILIDGKKVGEAGFANVIKGGSINVTLKDAESTTEASLTRGDYTPVGTVSLAKNNAGSFQVSGTNSSSEVTINSTDDTFVKSLKAGNVDAAAIDMSKFNGGSVATWTGKGFTAATYSHSGFSGGSLTKGTAVKATTEGLVASVGSGVDAETLIFTPAATADTMSHDASFTPAEYGKDSFSGGSIEWGTFNGGSAASIAEGFFTAQKLPVVDGTASALTGITSAEAAAQTFVGDKFAPAFSGTTETGLKVSKVEYVKQDVDAKTFTPETAALSFSGTKANQILVTGVTYDKADATAAFSETVTPETKTLTRTAKTVEITVTPDPKA